jgi:hypothetical protein
MEINALSQQTEGRVLRRIFGPKREELMRGLRKFDHMVVCSMDRRRMK